MMWAKKIAAGVLAAALSLTLLSGCSGGRSGSGSVISEGETISFDTSASYRLVQYTGNIYQAYELECTNEKDGTKIYAGQANKARCFAGTHEAITMDVRTALNQREGKDADDNMIQPGLYTVNYKDNTYKEGGTFGSVEKVLAATIFCNYENENGTLKEVRAASGTKNKQEYYVELLKFDFGTAAVFYTKDPWKCSTPRIPGKRTPPPRPTLRHSSTSRYISPVKRLLRRPSRSKRPGAAPMKTPRTAV